MVPAGESDAATAIAFWDAVAAQRPLLGRVEVVMGDSSFAGLFADHLRQRYGLRFEKPTHLVLQKKSFCIHQEALVGRVHLGVAERQPPLVERA